MLSNSKNELKKIIREKRNDNNYIFLIDMKLGKLRKKLIVYFIILFTLGLLFIYYVTAFCSVYRNSQKYWFIGLFRIIWNGFCCGYNDLFYTCFFQIYSYL